jgi:glycyl-tRNA synthetase beta chain
MSTLLFEIGTEEIPARFMEASLKQLQALAIDRLEKIRLPYDSLKVYGTPRRLALQVLNIANKQEDLKKEVKGPAKKAAFDADGQPTKAALGFAKSQGVSIENLVLKENDNGAYMYAMVEETGKPAETILPELLLELINALNFPKPMRWGSEELRFARPIRWIVALLDREIIPLSIANVNSGRTTRGHRFLAKEDIILYHADEYKKKLRDAYCMVDQEKRKEAIWWQIEALANKVGGEVKEDATLLNEVNFLVEYPTALCGTFPKEYLQLPQEVLITPMREHQRYFPVFNQFGKLMNKFITVRNGNNDHIENVIAGNEKVLIARLDDAAFFFAEDRKIPLENRLEKLKKVVFQEALGTVYEKTERVTCLATFIANELKWDEAVTNQVATTAHLAKADLASHMVYEFPELQGIMGAYYASYEGYPEAICQGIKEHYQPRFAGDEIAKSLPGIAVGIADKIDTIVGCFSIGLIPTGSQDPYALRRQALGICHTVVEHHLDISLKRILNKACDLYDKVLKSEQKEKTIQQIFPFFMQRVENIMGDKGIRYDIVNSVMQIEQDDIADILDRAEALSAFSKDEHFIALATAFTRAGNLTKNSEICQVIEGNFVDDVERVLYQKLIDVRLQVDTALNQKNYIKALREISTLRGPVDQFFSEVMIMVEDLKIKNNRIGLLQSVVREALKIADLAQIVVK